MVIKYTTSPRGRSVIVLANRRTARVRGHGKEPCATRARHSDIAAIMGITEAMAHVYAQEDTEALQRAAIKSGTNVALVRLAKLARSLRKRCILFGS
jgi:ABC-type protease/lipase transport system fused ATPase/permease subunit